MRGWGCTDEGHTEEDEVDCALGEGEERDREGDPLRSDDGLAEGRADVQHGEEGLLAHGVGPADGRAHSAVWPAVAKRVSVVLGYRGVASLNDVAPNGGGGGISGACWEGGDYALVDLALREAEPCDDNVGTCRIDSVPRDADNGLCAKGHIQSQYKHSGVAGICTFEEKISI